MVASNSTTIPWGVDVVYDTAEIVGAVNPLVAAGVLEEDTVKVKYLNLLL